MRMLVLAALVSSVTAMAQTYDPIYPPATTVPGWAAWCYDIETYQQTGAIVYVQWCDVTITIGGYWGSNAHFTGHGYYSDLVLSPMSCDYYFQCSPTSGTSIAANTWSWAYVPLTMHNKLVGFAQWFNVSTAVSGGTINFAVGYNDIYYNDHPEMYRVGGSETGGGSGHGETWYNRYMATGAAYSFYYATLDYLAAHAPQQKICTNDMALPFGGKFDIHKNWTNPHEWHDRGVAVDVAVTGSGQCPDPYEIGDQESFLQACQNYGGSWSLIHYDNPHIHCQFQNPSSYPH